MRIAPCDKDMELPFSIEEAGERLDAYLDACDRGDEEEADRIIKEFPMPPSIGLALKRTFGADYVRNCGHDLSQVEKVFGKDWLDRD